MTNKNEFPLYWEYILLLEFAGQKVKENLSKTVVGWREGEVAGTYVIYWSLPFLNWEQ